MIPQEAGFDRFMAAEGDEATQEPAARGDAATRTEGARQAKPSTGKAGETSALTKRQRRRRRKAASPSEPATGEALPSVERTGTVGKPPRRRRRKPGVGGDGGMAAGAPKPAVPARSTPDSLPKAASFGPARIQDLPPSEPAGDAPRPPVYAALDLGTNNCRLLVAVPTRPGQFRVIDAFSRIVRLGEGLGRTGRLAGPAMDRAIGALAICSQKLAARQVAGARLIATEACRAAANGEEFIERVARETGLVLEIVSRESEARLAVSGCGSLVDRSAKGAVLFDIGGGSSEIALLDLRGGYSRRLSSHIVAWTSLPVGVVSLAERHGGRDVSAALFETMIGEVIEGIEGFAGRHALDELVGGDNFHLLGTSGTVTTLAGVHLGLERYDRRQVDGLWLDDADVTELVARIAGWSFEERVANPCIGSDRADLVLAGCAILEAIRRVWPSQRLRVADRGLREGLLTEMMVADGVWRKGAPLRQKAMA
ncbi:Ppx/GppA phosphatase family protein [Aureimonas glaciei]|uniref:Exopolyphosphatase n=1 Tax=Aureimonas glaciei TaxID=1776957 RepID=A0A916Y8X5_9HYPH|nr:exopolyphosphatase [Aureimonas glaciei]